jgi:hypothetical protein
LQLADAVPGHCRGPAAPDVQCPRIEEHCECEDKQNRAADGAEAAQPRRLACGTKFDGAAAERFPGGFGGPLDIRPCLPGDLAALYHAQRARTFYQTA